MFSSFDSQAASISKCQYSAFVYCRDAQPVPRLDLAAASADLARLPYETPNPYEAALGVLTP